MALVDDSRRLEAMLRDLCPTDRRETRLVVDALREGIPQRLSGGSVNSAPLAVKIQQLAQVLETELAIRSDAAQWAVETWAAALGLATAPTVPPAPERISDQQPVPVTPPPLPPSPTPQPSIAPQQASSASPPPKPAAIASARRIDARRAAFCAVHAAVAGAIGSWIGIFGVAVDRNGFDEFAPIHYIIFSISLLFLVSVAIVFADSRYRLLPFQHKYSYTQSLLGIKAGIYCACMSIIVGIADFLIWMPRDKYAYSFNIVGNSDFVFWRYYDGTATSFFISYAGSMAAVSIAIILCLSNIRPLPATMGGAIGGALGGWIMFIITHNYFEIPSLCYSLLSGLVAAFGCAGLYIGDSLGRRAWLEWDDGKSIRSVTLGKKPVRVGSDLRTVDIYQENSAPVALAFTYHNGSIFLQEPSNPAPVPVPANDIRTIGATRFIARARA
jgi:hypothetical protein